MKEMNEKTLVICFCPKKRRINVINLINELSLLLCERFVFSSFYLELMEGSLFYSFSFFFLSTEDE